MSTVEKKEKNVVEFEFSVSGEEFRGAIEKAYKQNVGKINIQGFRRGKAPRQIIERYYGSEVFFEDAVNIVLPDAYDKAIDEQSIEAVAQPEIDVKSISREDGVVFTAKVAVKPEFELGQYKAVEVSKITHRTTEKEIKGEIENIRQRNSRMITVEDRAAQLEDTVNIDFEGFTDGVAFEGGKGESFDLVIMDPPRAGASLEFLRCLCELAPERIVYVSCNPETLARDLSFLTRKGYKARKIQPVDMFPHTEHVETVVLLVRTAQAKK